MHCVRYVVHSFISDQKAETTRLLGDLCVMRVNVGPAAVEEDEEGGCFAELEGSDDVVGESFTVLASCIGENVHRRVTCEKILIKDL